MESQKNNSTQQKKQKNLLSDGFFLIWNQKTKKHTNLLSVRFFPYGKNPTFGFFHMEKTQRCTNGAVIKPSGLCLQRHHVETEDSFSGQLPAIEFNRALARAIASSQSPIGDPAVQSATKGFIHPGRWDISRCSQERSEEDSAAVQSIEVLRLAQNQPTFTARFLSGQAGAVRESGVRVQVQRS